MATRCGAHCRSSVGSRLASSPDRREGNAIGLAAGWLADRGSEPTADDVAAHIAEISATEKFTIPETNYEEVFEITERLTAASP